MADWYHSWVRKLLGTRSNTTTSGLMAAVRNQPSPNENGSATHSSNVPLLTRVRTVVQQDKQYLEYLQNPPEQYLCKEGLLFRDNATQDLGRYAGPAVLRIPQDNALRQDLLHLVHDRTHFGAHRTYESARRCFTCQRMKPANQSAMRPQLPEMRFYPHPFHTIVVDVVEGLPVTPDHHNAVITVVDRLTKFAVYIPMHTSWSAMRQAQALLENVIYRYHTPSIIHTDNGPAYRKLFQAYCTALGITHKTGTPYHSQSQGPVERQHRTLLQTLRSLTDQPTNWDQYL